MPTYISQTLNGCTLHVIPHDLKRRFFRSIPFYNGSPISFDLVITIPRCIQLTGNIIYAWSLCFKGKREKPERKGGGIVSLAEMQAAKRWFRTQNVGLDYIHHVKETVFTQRNAIVVGRLLGEFGRYELRLTATSKDFTASKEWVPVQFDLKNIDELGVHLVNAVLAAAFGALAGLVASIIYIWLMNMR